MRAEGIKFIIATPYFDPKALKFVADKSGSRIVSLAHQVGGQRGADDYLGMINFDVQALSSAFAETR
jgi:ABC-type Zn uptake system ZnuABC Zn-binding protein ZnuA